MVWVPVQIPSSVLCFLVCAPSHPTPQGLEFVTPSPVNLIQPIFPALLPYLPKPQLQDLVCRTAAVRCAFRTGSGNRKQDPGNYFYQFQVESTDFSVFEGHFMYGMLNAQESSKPADTRPFVFEAGFPWELFRCSFVVYGHQDPLFHSLPLLLAFPHHHATWVFHGLLLIYPNKIPVRLGSAVAPSPAIIPWW